MKITLVLSLLFLTLSPQVLEGSSGDRSYLKAIRNILGSIHPNSREERQLVGVHIFEHPKNLKKSGSKRQKVKTKVKAKDIHGGHGHGGYGHDIHGGGYGHDIHGGGYGHDDHHSGGYGHDDHHGGYGHDVHGGGGGYGHDHGGYKEPPKKVKPTKYHGPRYSPYDLVAPDKSKKGKLKYGDDPVNESKKGAYHRKKYDKPIKHFGGFGGGGSVGYNAGSLKGHGGGYKGHGGHGGGGYKGHGGHGGGYKGHGGGSKGHGGHGGGYKGHGGHGGGYKGHGGHGGGYKGHGGGGHGGYKGHDGGHKGHLGGFKGHGGGYGGGHKGHGGGYGGGHTGHGGGYGGGHKGHGGGHKGYGGGSHKGYGGGSKGHKLHGRVKKGLDSLKKGFKGLKGGSKGGGEYSQPQYEYVILDHPTTGYEHLSSPYNTYNAHANVRASPDGKGVDVSQMLLSDPYTEG